MSSTESASVWFGAKDRRFPVDEGKRTEGAHYTGKWACQRTPGEMPSAHSWWPPCRGVTVAGVPSPTGSCVQGVLAVPPRSRSGRASLYLPGKQLQPAVRGSANGSGVERHSTWASPPSATCGRRGRRRLELDGLCALSSAPRVRVSAQSPTWQKDREVYTCQ